MHIAANRNRMMAAALALAWAAAGGVRVGRGPAAAMAFTTGNRCTTTDSRQLLRANTPSCLQLAAAPFADSSSSHSRPNVDHGLVRRPWSGELTPTRWQPARRHPLRGLMTTTATAEGAGSGETTTTETLTETTETKGRISRGEVSTLDARAVTDNLPMVLSHLRSRRASPETVEAAERIASLNSRRVDLIKDRDAQLSRRKEQSAVVGKIMQQTKGGNEATDEQQKSLEEAKALSGEAADEAERIEEELNQLEKTVSDLLASLPNLLDDVVPDGNDEDDNELVEQWGDPADLPAKLGWDESDGFEPRWHDDVASGLNGWKADEAVGMSGARFVALSGPVARLERALSSFFLDLHTDRHGYVETSVPYVVGRSALEGTSQLPKFEDDLFRIAAESHTCNGEDAFLIPTAEVPLTNLHRESILDESDLPLSYVALTPCFRAEAGSYGRDTRGLVRTHQFHKVELVKVTSADDSEGEHEALTRHAQACLEALGLPYRKVRLCSGDIGFGARHCYDLEVWLPGQGVYKEISSCSNCGDFQAKRMGMRYRPAVVQKKNDEAAKVEDGSGGKKKKKKKAKKPKPVLCHTINGSGLAVGRALVAVLENYQRPDGSVVVPEVLQPYMGGLEVLEVSAGK